MRRRIVTKIRTAGLRARAVSTLARIGLIPNAGATALLRLCELLAASHRSVLPHRSLSEVLADLRQPTGSRPDSCVLHSSLRGPGSGSVAEMAALSLLCAAIQPRCILEFGTHQGYSTWHLRANSSPDTKLFTIDLPAGASASGSTDPALHGPAERPYLPRDANTTLIEADSREWVADLPLPVDFCFVDAGHSYACVKNDTEKALQVLSPQGLVVWHDATWRHDGYGVWRYLRELRAQGHAVYALTLTPYDYCGLAVRLPRIP